MAYVVAAGILLEAAEELSNTKEDVDNWRGITDAMRQSGATEREIALYLAGAIYHGMLTRNWPPADYAPPKM